MSFQSPSFGRGHSVGDHGPDAAHLSLSRSASDAGGNWDKSLNTTDDGGSIDVPDGVGGDAEKTREAVRLLQDKIDKTMSKLRQEQADKEENVQDYLQALVSTTDKHRQENLKAMFEKRNNRTSQNIWHLQRKLENYDRRVNELRRHGAAAKPQGSRQPKEVLKDVSIGLKHVSGNIKDGITGLSGTVMSKPREFAHLIRNKFGSADNISSMQQSRTVFYIDESPSSEGKDRHGSSTLPARLPHDKDPNAVHVGGEHHARDDWKGSGGAVGLEGGSITVPSDLRGATEDGSLNSDATSSHLNSSPVKLSKAQSGENNVHAAEVLAECHALRSSIERLKEEILEHKAAYGQDSNVLSSLVWEDRAKIEQQEEGLNDVIDFHQKSVEKLRESITTMEERLLYQMNERFRDLQDLIEGCSNRVSRLEHQYAQHAQVVSFDNIQNRRFRAVIVRLVNFCLGILQLVLFTATIVSDIVTPFVRTRYHVIVSVLALAAALVGLKKWSKLAGFVTEVWRKKKSIPTPAGGLSASSFSPSINAGHCPVSSILDFFFSRCPPAMGEESLLQPSVLTTPMSLAKPASSSSLTTAAVLLCICSFAFVALATLGTRGLRLGIMIAVVILALGVVLPL